MTLRLSARLPVLSYVVRSAAIPMVAYPMGSFVFREAVVADIPALAAVHVTTWNATYPSYRNPPTVELRERQWREAFALRDGSWFSFVIEDGSSQLARFAKGKYYCHADLPDFSGELNKIYVLKDHQRAVHLAGYKIGTCATKLPLDTPYTS